LSCWLALRGDAKICSNSAVVRTKVEIICCLRRQNFETSGNEDEINPALYAHSALECPSVFPRLLDKGIRDVQTMSGSELLQKSSPASGVKHRVEVASNHDLQVRAALLRESRSKLIVGGFQKLVGVAGMWHIHGYRSKFAASEVEVERRNPVTIPAQFVS
jgi:hypothetical protein